MFYSMEYSSPMGMITLACDGGGKNLAGLWLEGQKYYGGAMAEAMKPDNNMPVFDVVKKWLDRYFAGKRPAVSELPLAPSGGEFRQGVWKVLREIPYGEIITYGDIAKKMNRKTMSSQAVGGAVAHNPISIIIPCHRVVGANGSLTGYAGGITTKIKLLELEGADTSRLFVPMKETAL